MKHILGISLVLSVLLLTGFSSSPTGPIKEKIGGVSLVSPPNRVNDAWTGSVSRISADWVSLLPYGFSYSGAPEVIYNLDRQWWGERFDGMTELIRHAHDNGLKVMLKPMVWIMGGWVGGFDLKTEKEWAIWEETYSGYILESARIAAAENVEMFCLGTEFKIASNTREKFWRKLIKEVREIYPGKVTYAANWDEFEGVRFWDALDYVGLDAYFPLVEAQTPDVKSLRDGWAKPFKKIQLLHKIYGKPILFTEFGYRSIDNCGWKQWELEGTPYNQKINHQAQNNAYQAFFERFWDEEWFAGVFLWQWYTNDARAGGEGNSDYTIQNKPSEKLIRSWFNR